MKLAFITDMHFGYRRFEEDAHQQGREAILEAARQADIIILGGDNFDSPLPRMETLSQVVEILVEARNIFTFRGIIGDVPIFAIYGNHERRAKGFVHPTELMEKSRLLRQIHNKTEIIEKNGEKVAISGMGNVPDDLACQAIKQISCKPIEGAFNVFVLHQSFQEYDVTGNEELMGFSDLPEGYNLYLCGHVHKRNMDSKVLNPGSTVVTQLREEEAGERGWLLYDTDGKKAEFKPVKSREFIFRKLEFEKEEPSKINARVFSEVNGILAGTGPGANSPLVRIIVKGSVAEGFKPSDISLPSFGENVFIDNKIGSESLMKRLSEIKLSREKKLSSKDLGMRILRDKLAGTSYSLGDPEKVFEGLLDGTFLDGIRKKIEEEAGKERQVVS